MNEGRKKILQLLQNGNISGDEALQLLKTASQAPTPATPPPADQPSDAPVPEEVEAEPTQLSVAQTQFLAPTETEHRWLNLSP
ncbi:MAG: hypothetical protein DYG89_43025 [Caldilinea sp. CFX5]|nr:hypothetical protein [Caldilinea sp. CFX5]